MKKYSLRYSFAACLVLLFSVLCARAHAQPASQASQAASTSSADAAIPVAQLLQPEGLVQMLRSSGEKPLVLQVGSHVLYAEAHIPGSEYAGAGGQEAGLQALRDRVKGLDRIIGISMDDEEQPVRVVYQKYGLNYPVVMGDEKLGEMYGGILGLPVTFLIGRNGKIRFKHQGAADFKTIESEIQGLLSPR